MHRRSTAPRAPASGASRGRAAAPAAVTQGGTLNIDFATYNPLSLVIKDQGWLEAGLAAQDVTVNWVKSAGSNKANEALRADAIDVGSTAGSAALLARSNGSPIQVIDIFSQPEWAAIVVPEGLADHLRRRPQGQEDRRDQGHRPVLLPAPGARGGRRLSSTDVTVEVLQHADGWAALQNGSVDAWAGLDPIMAGAEEAGAKLLYRNVGFNSYGFLDATESFLKDKPDLAQAVVDAYEQARAWAQAHPGRDRGDPRQGSRARSRRGDRRSSRSGSNLDVDPVPGAAQIDGPVQDRPDLRRVRRRQEPGRDRRRARRR